MITIERDFVICFGTRVERPERLVPGDWLSLWDRFENPVDYQEAFEAGVESVSSELEEQVSDLEEEVNDLRGEVRSLERELEDANWKIERLEGAVE